RKLAGLLVETSGEMQGPSQAVIGVGVNWRLAERVLDRIDQPVIDVVSCASDPPSRTALLSRLLSELATVLEAFERAGFAPLHDGRAFGPMRALPTGAATMHGDLFESDRPPRRAIASNVAGPQVRELLETACARHGIALEVIRSLPEQLGVLNGYADPAQLGT